MTMATPIRKTFNWGGRLTVSGVQSLIIMMGSIKGGGMQAGMVL